MLGANCYAERPGKRRRIVVRWKADETPRRNAEPVAVLQLAGVKT